MFPSTQHVIESINKHGNDFFNNMSHQDLSARNVASIEEYRTRYINSIRQFSENEKDKVIECVEKIDDICHKFKNFLNIDWKFGKVCCNIENGYPHTLGDIIILPSLFWNSSKEHQLETIAHEKIHVFQRQFPLLTNILIIQFWKYDILRMKSKELNIRNNPDINNIIYVRNGDLCYQTYKKNPKSLRDSSLVVSCGKEKYEHPYEKMAYTIADIIANNSIKDQDYIETMKWLRLYF